MLRRLPSGIQWALAPHQFPEVKLRQRCPQRKREVRPVSLSVNKWLQRSSQYAFKTIPPTPECLFDRRGTHRGANFSLRFSHGAAIRQDHVVNLSHTPYASLKNLTTMNALHQDAEENLSTPYPVHVVLTMMTMMPTRLRIIHWEVMESKPLPLIRLEKARALCPRSQVGWKEGLVEVMPR